MRKVLCNILFWATIAPVSAAVAQTAAPAAPAAPAHEVDLAFTYSPQHRNSTAGNSFWSQGGSVEFSADLYRGFGVAADFSANHASNINGSGVKLTTLTTMFGPRYTWSRHKLAIFGGGLIGVSAGSDSVFPSPGGATQSARSFAAQVGGGVDLRLTPRIAVRPIEASWLRTQFPNGANNVQNTLQLSAGIVFRLQK